VVQDEKIKSPNPKALELHGYSEEEFTTRPIVDYIHPEDQELVMGRHQRRLKGEQLPTVYSYRIVNKGGDTRWVELNVVPIGWENRPATLCFMADITKRKQAEEERDRILAELRDALGNIKKLSGLLPICSYCKGVRDDEGYYHRIESYIRDHSEADFSHGICPECAEEHFPGMNLDEG